MASRASDPRLLVDAVTAIAAHHSETEAARVAAARARHLLQCDGISIVRSERNLCHYIDEDAISPLWKGKRFPQSACISGWVMRERQEAVIEDIRGDLRIPQDLYRETFVRSLAMVPMVRVSALGAVGAYWSERHRATADEISALKVIADALAELLSNGSLER